MSVLAEILPNKVLDVLILGVAAENHLTHSIFGISRPRTQTVFV